MTSKANSARRFVSRLLPVALALGWLVGCAPAATPENTGNSRTAATAIATTTRQVDGAAMVYVSEGEFIMGSTGAEIEPVLKDCRTCPDDWFDQEKPQHKVVLPAFWVDQYEVTNRQYRLFIDAGGYNKVELWTGPGWDWKTRESREHPQYWADSSWNQPDQPVVGVVWYEAVAYCRWAGARLPSEAEWEKAAGWDEGLRRKLTYPWGDSWDRQRANTAELGLRHTTPVGQFCREAGAASPYGACDMAGNAWEWCSTLHRSYPYDPDDGREDLEAKGTRTLRGGSWINERHEARTAYRLPPFPGDFILFDPTNGFRCAQSSTTTVGK
jgi:formylglycine-generating enzyme required for sulfatase activity